MFFIPKHLALLCALLLLGSCSKLEIDDETDDSTEQTDAGSDHTDTGGGRTTVSEGDVLYASEALAAETGTQVWVEGYIVGYVAGTSLAQAVFGLPAADANTNMLLADTPNETDYRKVFPVALTKSSGWREELNLYDNPTYYLRPIAICGELETYFKVNGIRTIVDYQWLDDDDFGGDDDSKGTGTGDDSGSTTGQTTADEEELNLSNDQKTVDEGR